MSESMLEILRLIQASLWQLIVVGTLIAFHRPIRRRLESLTTFKAGSVELGFAAAAMAAAEPPGMATDERTRRGAAARAVAARERCQGRLVLWVDDQPNRRLAETFHSLSGLEFLFAHDTDEALALLRSRPEVTMVISDMRRGDDDRAGIDLVEAARERRLHRPTVIYLMDLHDELGTPNGIVRVTNRPDELLHTIIDICERAYWSG